MTVESPPFAIQSTGLTYTAEQTRRAMYAALSRSAANSPGILAGGLLSGTDCQLSAPGAGLSVNVSPGELIIPGTEGGSQGGYYARVSSTTNLPIATANASNPRIDAVVATVSDSNYTEPTGGSGNQWALQVVTGTPTTGATLPNLLGAAGVPASSLLLGYVLVPNAATSVVIADIANAATVATTALYPPGVAALLAGLQAPWTAYIPTWTASGSAPAIGNGNLGGRYKIVGKTCTFAIELNAGSSTNGGAGPFNFALPAQAKIDGFECWVPVKLYSANNVTDYAGLGLIGSGATTVNPWITSAAANASLSQLSNSGPTFPSDTGGFPLQTGSNMFIGGTYELQ
jgi:hypothetical protein